MKNKLYVLESTIAKQYQGNCLHPDHTYKILDLVNYFNKMFYKRSTNSYLSKKKHVREFSSKYRLFFYGPSIIGLTIDG